MSGLARRRYRIESPLALARRGIVSINESAHAVLSAGHANHDQILHCQRRDGETVPGAIVGRDHVPRHVSGLCVEGDHVRIQRSEKNFVAKNRQPAVHPPATGTNVPGQLPLVHPNGPTRARIQRKRAVILRGRIKNAIDDQRRRLQLASRCSLIHPLRHQRAHIHVVDLIEPAEPLPRVIARVSHPVLRVLRRIYQAFKGDLRESVTRNQNASETGEHSRQQSSQSPSGHHMANHRGHGGRRGNETLRAQHSSSVSSVVRRPKALPPAPTAVSPRHFAPTLIK